LGRDLEIEIGGRFFGAEEEDGTFAEGAGLLDGAVGGEGCAELVVVELGGLMGGAGEGGKIGEWGERGYEAKREG
jgi:hypothetical protein